MKTETSRKKNRTAGWIALTAFLFMQVLQPALQAAEPLLEQTAQGLQPAIAVTAQTPAPVAAPGVPAFADPDRSLSPAAPSEIQRAEDESRDLEEYGFDEALDQLRPDVASAVIVKSITSQDLRKLTELEFEVGITVLYGKTVLFTSGSEDEIRVLPPARELLEKATLLSHVHPKGQRGMPSLTDIQEAGDSMEYVVSEDGVYAYNHEGLESPYARDYGWFARQVNALSDDAASSKPARDILNTFIKTMDDYNADKEAGVLLRAGDPPTVLPGQPVLTAAATNGYITVDQFSSSSFRMNYPNFSASAGRVAAVLNFAGPQNLAGLAKLTFEMKRSGDCLNPAGLPCGAVELVDATGRVAVVNLRQQLTPSWTQVDITLAPLAANVDLTHLTQIRFVVTTDMGGSIGNPWEIHTGGLAFSTPLSPEGYPVLSGQALDLTKITELPGYPIPSAQAQNGAVITQSQLSSQNVYFNYKVSDADDLATSKFDFSAPQNLGSAVTLAVSGPTGRQIKVQVVDAAGKVANYYLNIGAYSQFTIPLTGAGLPLGFDPSKIVRIQFVLDQAHAGSYYNNSESVTINTKGLAYVVNGLPYDAASITALPGHPAVTSSAAGGGSITQNQTSSRNFSFNYNVAAAGATAFSEISWGQFVGGVFQGIPGPCGGTTGKLILAVNGPAGKRIKLQFVDANGKTADYLLNLTGSLQNYHLLMSALPPGFDINKMAAIRFIPEVSQTGATGTIAVETNGLFYDPSAIPPSATLRPSDIRPIPVGQGNDLPRVVPLAPQGAVSTGATTARGAYFHFETNAPGWSGTGFSYDDFTTPAMETGNLTGLSKLEFGLKGTVPNVKVEFVDNLDHKYSVRLTGIRNDAEQVWQIQLASVTGVDLSKLRMIYFIVEGQNLTGNLEINQFPPGSSYPRVYQSSSEITALPGNPTNNTIVPAGATGSMTTTPRGGVLTYNTGGAGWVGGGFNYDNFGTPAIETGDLSAYKNLIVGLKGTPTRVKVEVIDDQNKKTAVYLHQVNYNNAENEWMIATADLAAGGVNLARVRMIYFIIEGVNQTGTLEINRVPTAVQPSTGVSIQPLPNNPPLRVVKVAPAGVTANATAISRGLRLDYQTGTAGWAGAGFTYDDPATPAVETANLSTLPYLGFGIKGDVTQIKLEIVDADGRKASVKFTGIRSDLEQRWAISLLPFEAYGIDLTRVKTLYFIVEGQNLSGGVEIYRLP